MSAVSNTSGSRQRQLHWRSPISSDTLSTLVVVSVLLLIPLLTLDIVGWAIELDIILPVTLFSAVFGLILARSKFGELTALAVSFCYSIVISILAAAIHLDLPFRQGIIEVLNRSFQWVADVFSGGINTDELVLTLLVAILFWFLAYNANWHIFRLDRVWVVILPPGLILLANIVFFSIDEALDVHLFAFLMMALVLIVRSNLNRRHWDWYIRGVRVPRVLRRQFAMIGILLSLLSLAFAWSIPSNNLQNRLDTFQEFLASDPIQQMVETWNRLFAPLEGDGPLTTDYYGADLLNLSGAVSLGDDVVFTVDAPLAPYRYYWRSRIFERYINGQWSPSADLRFTDRAAPLEVTMNSEVIGARRQPVSQRFTIGTSNSRIYYAAPQPESIDKPGRIDLIYTDKPNNTSMNMSVIRPLKVLRRGESYTANSLISIATADELRGATRDYPPWVSSANLYIGAPNTRVLELSRQIVAEAGAVNPYDQAKAIESWLRQNISYNESISEPPPGVDTVEWLLFDAREGYCTYYATAMIVMLRHLEIPARLAAGFSQGVYDANISQFVVREREAHTWVEVYFPGYGWIEFEPTTAQVPIHREGDELAQERDVPLNPEPTMRPTSAPTPTTSPSPEPSQEARGQNLTEPTATSTATPAPSPSPTPAIFPTVQPPISPNDPPPLSLLQPAVYFALVVISILFLLTVVGLLLFWWWEWRGLGEYSPITRAYARLERYIQLLGINTRSAQTTLEKRRELQQRIPAAKEPIRTISDLYTYERYGGGSQDPNANKMLADSAEKAWYRTRGNILRRWLRRWIPFFRGD